MKAKLSFCVLLLFSFSAGAQTPSTTPPTEAKPPAAAGGAAGTESGLTGQILYQFLLGEIAGQRGDLTLATEAYADLANKTRDVRVVRRAAEIAIYARNMAKAAEMARLWVELEPKSIQAHRLLVTALIGQDKLDEAQPQLEALLGMPETSPSDVFLQLHGLLSHHADKAGVLRLVQGLAAAYPSLPEAHQAVAQSALDAGRPDVALSELDAALRLAPDSEAAVLLKGQALASQGDEPVLEFWKGFLAQHPDATRVRLAYARGLTKTGRFEDARKEFEILLKGSPGSPELHLAVGLLGMQMNDLDGAQQHFTKALDLGFPDQGLVQFYLGQICEARHQYEQALEWYGKVAGGEHALQARFKVALILGKLNRVDEAMAGLRKMEAEPGADTTRIVQTEAQLLRDADRYQDAFDVLTRALKQNPDSGDLLYDRAMVEERLDRLADMETDLRQLIKLQPNSAHAYNALGYTLIDRTTRIDEGIALLNKALQLSPDDPFILDSMGWGQYKAGHLDEAIDYLSRAYKGRADPEIAAHLGEVLWQKGDQAEAKRIWQEAAKADPDNDLLRKTLSRFGQ